MSHHSEHSYARLLYHFVWATDERKPFITPAVEEKLYASIGQICQQRDWHLRAIGGTENHIHLVVQLPIKCALPDVVARIKSNSCQKTHHQRQSYAEECRVLVGEKLGI